MKKYLKIASNAAKLAYKSLDTIDKETDIKENRIRDVKLLSDVKSENAIIDYLSLHSNFSILSEEVGLIKKKNDYLWIIDPIDGSLNYSRDIPLSCISISLWKENKPLLGVIYDFNNNDFYSSIVGLGAHLNGNKIYVNHTSKISEAVLCTGFPVSMIFNKSNISGIIKKIINYKKVRLLGTAGLSLAYVASGKVDAYYEENIKIMGCCCRYCFGCWCRWNS